MHYLQKAILDKLRYDQPLTYTALMPEGIESSHFRYHLKQLITDQLVAKDEQKQYHLTLQGQRAIDRLSSDRTTLLHTPKIITYTLLTHQGRMLLYKKPKEPYRNLWGLIGGKVHFGEDIRLSAQREVTEKTGWQVDVPELCGIATIIINNSDSQPLSHVVAYVHRLELAEVPAELPLTVGLVDSAQLAAYDCIPDLSPLLEYVQAGQFPFTCQLTCSLV